MNNSAFSVALVGAGNMGGSMLQGWLADGFPPGQVHVIDPSPIASMQQTIGEYRLAHHETVPQNLQCDVVLVAVKPQIFDGVLPSLLPLIGPGSVVLSVAAGKTISGMAAILGDCAIVRTMSNTPAQVRRAVTVCVGNGLVNQEHRENVTGLLKSIGLVEWVDEEALIDAVTGLSGSGPAYVFHLVEAMTEAGIAAGLPEELAMVLARETVCGAGELMHCSPLEPAQLRKNVTSPNGTTEAGLEVLMGEGGLGDLMTRAVKAATSRSRELAK